MNMRFHLVFQELLYAAKIIFLMKINLRSEYYHIKNIYNWLRIPTEKCN